MQSCAHYLLGSSRGSCRLCAGSTARLVTNIARVEPARPVDRDGAGGAGTEDNESNHGVMRGGQKVKPKSIEFSDIVLVTLVPGMAPAGDWNGPVIECANAW